MWNKPYGLQEGTAIVIGLMLIGVILQLGIGPIDWKFFAWPVNIIVLLFFVVILFIVYILRSKLYIGHFMTSFQAAVPAIAGTVVLSLLMGLTRQVSGDQPPADKLGFTRMTSCWPFILVYFWMTSIVGEVALKQLRHFRIYKIPVLISHVGLFIVLTCATLGNADMQRLKMYCNQGVPEFRAIDNDNNVHELEISVRLNQFAIDEYPARLMIVSDKGKSYKDMQGWTVRILKQLDDAVPATSAQLETTYAEKHIPGSATAWLVDVSKGSIHKKGWVSCGSFMYPDKGIELDRHHYLVMPQRLPKRFISDVNVYTKDGDTVGGTVEVNHPLTVKGWKIYQLGYDERMGKWSNLSIFELVSDPWLPAVYAGIILLLSGALGMFFFKKK